MSRRLLERGVRFGPGLPQQLDHHGTSAADAVAVQGRRQACAGLIQDPKMRGMFETR